MRRTTALLAGLLPLSIGLYETNKPQPLYGTEFGAPVAGLTAEELETFKEGAELFDKIWHPDPSDSFFNASSCMPCHREPAMGGASSDPFLHVFFVRDEKDVSGWQTFPWLRRGRGGNRLPHDDHEVRRPNPLFGLGLVEAVPQADLEKLADPTDKDKDGISGRLLYINGKIGRFGWKGSVPSMNQFVNNAFRLEIGLPVGKGTGANQLTPERLHKVVDMLRMIAPPPQPKTSAIAEEGKKLFTQIGCVTCHTPNHTTGYSEIAALKDRVITPYSDLLVHDVSRGKAELTTEGKASRREYRTAPLWGLGEWSGPYWHDGSTQTLEDAVDRHEGEALKSRDNWRALKPAEKEKLLTFLRSL